MFHKSHPIRDHVTPGVTEFTPFPPVFTSKTTTPTPLSGIRLNPCAAPLWGGPSDHPGRSDSKHTIFIKSHKHLFARTLFAVRVCVVACLLRQDQFLCEFTVVRWSRSLSVCVHASRDVHVDCVSNAKFFEMTLHHWCSIPDVGS